MNQKPKATAAVKIVAVTYGSKYNETILHKNMIYSDYIIIFDFILFCS